MELKTVITLIREKFQNKIDTSTWDSDLLSEKYLYKAEYQNKFALVSELQDADYFEIIFFKSDRKNEKILDDCLDVGICFRPKSIDNVKTILYAIDA